MIRFPRTMPSHRTAWPCIAALPILCLSLMFTELSAEIPAPPVAKKVPFTHREHGVERPDDFAWLRKKKEPAVKQYVKAENAYTEAVMAPLKPLQDTLYKEMRARMVDEDISVPVRRGKYLFFSKYPAGADYECFYRKENEKAPDELILDENVRAKGKPNYQTGGGSVSLDDRLYAWKENDDGTDIYTLRVLEIATGKLLPDEVGNTANDSPAVWANDNKTLFYTEADDTQRSWRVKRHTLGEPATQDVVVYEEADARFSVDVSPTKSRKYIVIEAATMDTSETWLIPSDQPHAKPEVIVKRRDGIEYDVTHHDTGWYITSNEDGATNGKLWLAPEDKPGRENWKEVWPYDETLSLEGVDSFADYLVVSVRKQGEPGLFIVDPKSHERRWMIAPEKGAALEAEYTPDYHATAYRVSYESFLTPYTVADMDLKTGAFTVLKRKEVPSGFDPTKYQTVFTEATAKDGTKIPIWMALPKDHPKDGSGGLLLDGYGAYGMASDPSFDTDIFSLLDRGVGFAIAQIRGGGEFGRTWYEAGKLQRKVTTFTDYIACAEHLIKEGYTSPAQLCGYGGSAGGLVVGYAVNERPDLFRAFIADVPFVDALNTMLDASIPLTTGEYDEWGNPEADEEVFKRMRTYAPYENVKPQAYPSILVLAGWNDPRVPYWEPAKWVAKMRSLKTDKNLLLLKTNFDAGHGGTSGRYGFLKDIAFEYAYLLKELGRAGK